MSLRLDHVIYGVRDLDAAARRFRDDYGLDSVPGGEHVGYGTANRIVPLGDSYVEIMGPVDPDGPLAHWLLGMIADGERPIGWCVRTNLIGAVAARLGEEPVAMSRARPSGAEVSWRLVGLPASMMDPSLPFFIEWDDPAEHPGRMPAAHAAVAHGIAWVEVSGDPALLGERLGGADLPVRVVAGDPGVRALGIASGAGEIVIR